MTSPIEPKFRQFPTGVSFTLSAEIRLIVSLVLLTASGGPSEARRAVQCGARTLRRVEEVGRRVKRVFPHWYVADPITRIVENVLGSMRKSR